MATVHLPSIAPGLPAGQVDAALRQAVTACDQAQQCAVLWFAEVQRRQLFRPLGFASLHLYAVHGLGFSDNRYWQFKRLVDDLDRLPALRRAVASGEVGWTKARQIARVATAATEQRWVARAKVAGKRELEREVGEALGRVRAGRAARRSAGPDGAAAETRPTELAFGAPALVPGQVGGDPGAAAGSAPGAAPLPTAPADDDPPATIALRLDGLQLARFEALVERARKCGLVPRGCGRAEVVLAALEAWVVGDITCGEARGETAGGCEDRPAADSCRRDTAAVATVAPASARSRGRHAPVQVVVHRCPDCGRAAAVTSRGEMRLAPGQVEALACDADVRLPGGRNGAAIAPKVRAAVLARDRHRCAAPGCGSTSFLQVHHRVPRLRGGTNAAANLVTLCQRCHAFAHEGDGNGRTAASPGTAARRREAGG